MGKFLTFLWDEQAQEGEEKKKVTKKKRVKSFKKETQERKDTYRKRDFLSYILLMGHIFQSCRKSGHGLYLLLLYDIDTFFQPNGTINQTTDRKEIRFMST